MLSRIYPPPDINNGFYKIMAEKVLTRIYPPQEIIHNCFKKWRGMVSCSVTRSSRILNFREGTSVVRAISLSFTNARMINTLIRLACSEFRTFAACSTTCSMKTKGRVLLPPQFEFDVAICDFKISSSSLLI